MKTLVIVLTILLVACGSAIDPNPEPFQVSVQINEGDDFPCAGARTLTLEARTYGPTGEIISVEDLSPEPRMFFTRQYLSCDVEDKFLTNVQPGDRVAFFANMFDSSGLKVAYGWTGDKVYKTGATTVVLTMERAAPAKTVLVYTPPAELLEIPVDQLFVLLEDEDGLTLRSHEVDLTEANSFPYLLSGITEVPFALRFVAFDSTMTNIYAEAFPLTFLGDIAILD